MVNPIFKAWLQSDRSINFQEFKELHQEEYKEEIAEASEPMQEESITNTPNNITPITQNRVNPLDKKDKVLAVRMNRKLFRTIDDYAVMHNTTMSEICFEILSKHFQEIE